MRSINKNDVAQEFAILNAPDMQLRIGRKVSNLNSEYIVEAHFADPSIEPIQVSEKEIEPLVNALSSARCWIQNDRRERDWKDRLFKAFTTAQLPSRAKASLENVDKLTAALREKEGRDPDASNSPPLIENQKSTKDDIPP